MNAGKLSMLIALFSSAIFLFAVLPLITGV